MITIISLLIGADEGLDFTEVKKLLPIELEFDSNKIIGKATAYKINNKWWCDLSIRNTELIQPHQIVKLYPALGYEVYPNHERVLNRIGLSTRANVSKEVRSIYEQVLFQDVTLFAYNPDDKI
jgi:hypothetical protein